MGRGGQGRGVSLSLDEDGNYVLTLQDGRTLTLRSAAKRPDPAEADEPVTQDTCVSCGACCAEAGFVAVRPSDETPNSYTRPTRGLGLPREMAVSLGPRCLKRGPGGRCTALTGTIGTRVACGIYDRRPAVCRQFEPGSPGCLEARLTMRHKLADPGRRRPGYEERTPPAS